jgi:cellulose synthase/poly-beta-1,6-N-acetylglucosamine synthase-like glycosyltransferase
VRHDDNAGLAPRLNEGLSLARGEIIARLDADDVARKDRLARQVQALDENPDVALVAAHCINIDGRGRVMSATVSHYGDDELLWHLCIDSPFLHSSVTYRRAVIWDGLGGYDPSIVYGEDYEMWSRLVQRGYRTHHLVETLVAFRRHPASMSGRLIEHKHGLNLRVIRSNLQFAFPDVDAIERDRFAQEVAALNFGLAPITPQFVRQYMTFYRRFSSARGLSVLQMRRSLSAHFIRWGYFAKPHMRMRAFLYVALGLLLEPRHLAVFELPAPIRRLMAHQAGQFWMERA